MRIWVDTEFIEDGKTIDLISIGMVAEDGRELYLENSEADLSKANEWVQANVLPHLKGKDRDWPGVSVRRADIARHVQMFCDPETYGKPEFWVYYGAYDWVVLCQLFGRMIDLPKGWPMYCRDIKQWADMIGNPKLPEQGKGEHHALSDARWVRDAHLFLEQLQGWEFLRDHA